MINYTFTLGLFEYFLMIFVRVASFVFAAPFFGMTNIPSREKIGFSFVFSILLYQILPKAELDYSTTLAFSIIILKEAVTGLLIGYSANICTSIVLFAGRIIDMEIGLSMATMFDPVSKEESSVSASLYSYLVLMLLIISGLQQYLIKAFIEAYQLIPVNGLNVNLDQLYTGFLTFITDYVVIGFRIVLPIFACTFILNAILGILSKVAPQLNMFSVGMQLKVIIGLSIMFITIGMLPQVSDFIFIEIKKMVTLFVKGMY